MKNKTICVKMGCLVLKLGILIMYVLDANICLEYLKGNQKVVNKIQEVGFGECILLPFVYAELRFWAEISDDKEDNHQKVSDFAWYSGIEHIPSHNIIERIENEYWLNQVELYKKNIYADKMLLMLASFAYPYHIMVTDRIDEFKKFGNDLKIENWLE